LQILPGRQTTADLLTQIGFSEEMYDSYLLLMEYNNSLLAGSLITEEQLIQNQAEIDNYLSATDYQNVDITNDYLANFIDQNNIVGQVSEDDLLAVNDIPSTNNTNISKSTVFLTAVSEDKN